MSSLVEFDTVIISKFCVTDSQSVCRDENNHDNDGKRASG